MYRFPWYLTLVSTNHASSNPGQDDSDDDQNISSARASRFLVHFFDVHCTTVKPPNASFYGGSEHTTTNFPFFLKLIPKSLISIYCFQLQEGV